jgi:aarF domain-containing kinase
MEQAHVEALLLLGRPFSYEGSYDFSTQDVTERVQSLIPVMLRHRLTPPPEESYSLHRKLSGTFLLCARLGAKVPCKRIMEDIETHYNATPSDTSQ